MARHEEQTQPGSKRQNESKWVKSVRGEGGSGDWGVQRSAWVLCLLACDCQLRFAATLLSLSFSLSLSLSHSDFPLNRWRNEFLLGRTKELSLGRAGLALTGLQFYCGMWRLNLVRIVRFGQPVKQSIGYGVCIED